MSDKKQWIVKIVPVLAFAAGIVMASIGGVITISSTAKLILFDHEPYDYVSREECTYDDYLLPPRPIIEEQKGGEDTVNKKRTEDEIDTCLLQKRAEMKERFQQNKKQDVVDGISILIVGVLLILFFRKRNS